jgi:predicted RNA-binding Zn-ribbon protein involved in translation (DUF1610 family)
VEQAEELAEFGYRKVDWHKESPNGLKSLDKAKPRPAQSYGKGRSLKWPRPFCLSGLAQSYHNLFILASVEMWQPKKEQMQLPPTHFKDQNLRLEDFNTHVLVHCPQCQGRAEVRCAPQGGAAVANCPDCGWQKAEPSPLYSLAIRKYCENCDKLIDFKQERVAKKKAVIRIPCPHCGHEQNHEPDYRERREYRQGIGWGTDRYFGLDRWLAAECKGELFWANNHAHLAYLKAYIQAKVRQRKDRRFFTLVEKLPQGIKSAKNREALLKVIAKLEAK